MKMGSFFMYQLFFWMACGGAALLFIGQVLRLFAARWMLVASLSICAGFTLFSIVAYPAGYDDRVRRLHYHIPSKNFMPCWP
jgi:hypothetical protein